MKKVEYKVLDYININHHSNELVESYLNENYGELGYELVCVIDMGENNTNKDGKSSRFRYIFKRTVNEKWLLLIKLIMKDLKFI